MASRNVVMRRIKSDQWRHLENNQNRDGTPAQHSTAGRACSGSWLAIDIDDVNCVAWPSPCSDFVFACLSRLSAYLSYATCAALQLDKRERTSAGSYVFIRLASFWACLCYCFHFCLHGNYKKAALHIVKPQNAIIINNKRPRACASTRFRLSRVMCICLSLPRQSRILRTYRHGT